MITERDQERPADWPKEFTPLRMSEGDISVPKEEWGWRLVAKEEDLIPNGAGST
jgi:nitrite reductase (NAD(P)H)